MKTQRHLRWFILTLLVALPLWAGIQSARAGSVPWASLTASAGQASPYPVWVGGTCTVALKSVLKSVGSQVENLMATSQSWYITSVSYSVDDASWTTEWTGNSATANVPNFFDVSVSGGVGGGTISATLGENRQAGYYQIAFSTTASVEADVNGQTQQGTVSATGSTPPVAVKVSITYTGSVAGPNGDTTDSGTVVTSKTTNVHAGWPIQLGAVITPAAFAGNYKQFTWTISGAGGNGSAAINGYIVASDDSSAKVVPLMPSADSKATFPDPANTPAMLQSYYYTESGSYTASVNPSGVGVKAAQTTFSVAAPTTTLKVSYQYPTQMVTVAGGSPTAWIGLAAPEAIGQPSMTAQQAGILFSHPQVQNETVGDQKFLGGTYYLQVYTCDDQWTGLNGIKSYSATGAPYDGLDGSDPYAGTAPDPTGAGDDVAIDGPSRPTDGFPNTLSYSPVTINDSPTMWVMYTPACSGSIDIPLESSKWHWGGTATWNAATKKWNLANPAPAVAGPEPSGKTDSYPVWVQKALLPSPPN